MFTTSSFFKRSLNTKKRGFDHLRFCKRLIQELVMFHKFGKEAIQTRPNADLRNANMIRLVETHFFSKLSSEANKPRAERCVR